jgi:hypothetical protein
MGIYDRDYMKSCGDSDRGRKSGSSDEIVVRLVWKCLKYFAVLAAIVLVVALIVKMIGG